MHKYQKFIILNIYVPEILAEQLTLNYIIIKIYLIDNLQTKLFIKINIIELK